jgi:c(7)-type cytochrome triheme protein
VWCCGAEITRGVSWSALAALLLLPSSAAAAPPASGETTPTVASVTIRLPADLVYDHEVGPDSAVVFSHETHFALEDNRCTGCHPRPFKMLHPTHRTSHEEMNAGRSCGVCHDGTKAFGVRDAASCETCHSGRRTQVVAAGAAPASGAAVPAGPKVPKPHVYPAGESSPGRVTFKHEIHMKDGVRCVACHPKLFAMKAAPPKPEGGMHEASACGACHDGKKSFGTEDPDSCERCHSGGGGS